MKGEQQHGKSNTNALRMRRKLGRCDERRETEPATTVMGTLKMFFVEPE